MKLAGTWLQKRVIEAKVPKIDDLPANRWRTPLQRSVQLLKRHRDAMFLEKPATKPISVIITTLAGHAYGGETDIAEGLGNILARMENFVSPTRPRIPNPVNPNEDFADKWYDPRDAHLDLEASFWAWLGKARADFAAFGGSRDANRIIEHARGKLRTTISLDAAKVALGLSAPASLLRPPVSPSGLSFPPKPLIPNKPAGFAAP
jgi:hypothetical protein